MLHRIGSALSLGVAIGLLGVVATLVPSFMQLEEDAGLEWLFALRGPRPPPRDVVIVAMDRSAAKALGISASPVRWPREHHARVVRALRAAGAGVIVLDLFFDEPGPPAADRELAEAIREAGNVVVSARLRKEMLPAAAAASEPVPFTIRLVPPVEPIASAAADAPFPLPMVPTKVSQAWSVQPGSDGRATLPVAAVEEFARSTGDEALLAHVARWRRDHPSFFLNFYGPPRTIRTVPYDELLGGARLPDLHGKIAFVGYSARAQAEQRDSFPTVFSQADGLNLSGVEIAATAAGNILDARPLRPLPMPMGLGLLMAWGLGLGLACGLLFGAGGTVAAAVAAAGYFAVAAWAFRAQDLWVPLIVPLFLQAPVAAFSALFLQYRQVRAQRERIAAAFGHFVPPRLVQRLAVEGVEAGSAAETVYGTCMATDAAQYSLMSETLAPGELRHLMNSYYELLFEEVSRHDGFVSDVVGDAMMAIWASAGPEVAVRRQACLAALRIVAELGRRAAAGERVALPTRIGLHSGEIWLGEIGAGQHLEYRAVGDIVNTASRIEGLNKRLGTRILASAETLQGLEGFRCRELGAFTLAGKTKPVVIHELIGAGDASDPADAEFANALMQFRAERWQEAAALFRRCGGGGAPDGPARFYVELCDEALRSGRSRLENGAVRIAEK